MPNRIIKESICTSCEVEKLSWQQEVFWYRLLVQCDDYGRMDARPEILRARCFPLRLDRVSAKDINGFTKVLIETGLIEVYQVDGKPYLQIVKWEKHQQQRAKRSKYPASDGNCNLPDINGNQMISDALVIQSESERESESQSESEKKYEVRPKVFLTSDEVSKLIDKFGEDEANERLDAYSESKNSHGYKFKSDYFTILNWARRDEKERKSNGKSNGRKPLECPGGIINGADPDKFFKKVEA